MNWLFLKHTETGGTTEVPDSPDVRAWHEARGWKVVEPPKEVPFVPAPGDDAPNTESAWVDMCHPEVRTTHKFPNNPEAIAGAMESGWEFPASPEPVSDPPPAGETPAPKTRKSRPASADAEAEKENG